MIFEFILVLPLFILSILFSLVDFLEEMKSIKSKIKSWWTKRPMTYSLTHGSSTFSNKLTKFDQRIF